MTTQRADYLITGGLVISGTGISKQDVLVQGETILKIAPDLSDESAARVIDATGKYVMPGIIDAHARGVKMLGQRYCIALNVAEI